MLHASVTEVDEAALSKRLPFMERLLQSIEHEAGVSGSRGAPADNAPDKGHDHGFVLG